MVSSTLSIHRTRTPNKAGNSNATIRPWWFDVSMSLNSAAIVIPQGKKQRAEEVADEFHATKKLDRQV
jgi:hypothetical protein